MIPKVRRRISALGWGIIGCAAFWTLAIDAMIRIAP